MIHPAPSRAARLGLALLALVAVSLTGCGGGGNDGGDPNPPPPPSGFTLHYYRPARDLAGWSAEIAGGAAAGRVAASGSDAFGAVYTFELSPGATTLTFTMRNGATQDAAGSLSVDVSGTVREAWVFSGLAKAIPRRPPALPENQNQVALYYVRPDGVYTGWGLHLWGDQVTETSWFSPLLAKGSDPDLGLGFLIDVAPNANTGSCIRGNICFIVHKGETKDPDGIDIKSWNRGVQGDIVFLESGSDEVLQFPGQEIGVTIRGAAATLVGPAVLAWDVTDPAATAFELRASPTAAIAVQDGDVTGGEVIALATRAGGLTAAEKLAAPRVQLWRAFDVAAADTGRIPEALRGQLVAVARDATGKALYATQVQTALAIDALWGGYTGPLGVAFAGETPSFALWAPTAQAVTLRVLEADDTEIAAVPLTRAATGVWSHAGDAAWKGKHYRYALRVFHPSTGRVEDVETTDPYAVNLSTNGRAAQIVDLADPDLEPAGWDTLAKPPLAAPEDAVVYELHVRDFSASDTTVPAELRGKYLALTADADADRPAGQKSAGRAHLEALAQAGLTHLHLLPVFDIATVNEDPAARVDLDDPFADLCAAKPSGPGAVPTDLCGAHAGQTVGAAMASYPGDSERQQEIAGYLASLDAFNWGYDPLHYGAPEGSYASTAEGTAKIVEFRRMVQGIAGLGLRTVMDVVYNHTNASGLADKSVLDKVVPGYYHRLDVTTGNVTASSCCANTATEHSMMERLMIDTLVRWARDYKVDGFRFDLMGLHTRANMEHVRDALLAVNPSIVLYGEGWTMGDSPGATPATQLAMAGAGIGTFNDRLRDGVRGGGPFDNAVMPAAPLRAKQGFATGLFTAPNELAGAATAAELDALTDLAKVGMAGNLTTFRYAQTATGTVRNGSAGGYNGTTAIGYTADPQEVVNYVSKHDNQTLFDISQYKLPTGLAMSERVRVNTVALATVLLGQGMPFFHAGDDLLRSKSMERDSYDSGDWFNRIDWTGETSTWKQGLPNAGKDRDNWPRIRTIFADASIAPSAADVAEARAAFRDLLRVRRSSPLFRLRTADEIRTRVDFHNAGAGHVPGVIVMTVTDGACAGVDLDPARDAVAVVINADDQARTVTVPGAAGLALHALLADDADADPVVKTATVSGESVTVPGRTAAVFEQLQAGAQGAGLPCNTR